MNRGNIKIQHNRRTGSDLDSQSNSEPQSPKRQAAAKKISYGAPFGQISRSYHQREGQRNLNEDNFLQQDQDYPQLFVEDKIADHKLNSFEVYDQIYDVFSGHQNKELERIQRRYGHSERRAADHKFRLIKTFGVPAKTPQQQFSPLGGSVLSQSVTPGARNSPYQASVADSIKQTTMKRKTSRITKDLIKAFTPQAAHITSLYGGASEAGQVQKAQKRLKEQMVSQIPVNAASIKKYIREVTLNEKFRGTWVAHGLNDESTQTCLARRLKQPDLVDEIINAGIKAQEWLTEQDKIENTHLSFVDPPVELGRYYNDFCNRNMVAYSTYRTKGINQIVKDERYRYENKVAMQAEAAEKGILPSQMQTFNKKRDKEMIWRKIIPDAVLEQLGKRTQKFKSNAASRETSLQMSESAFGRAPIGPLKVKALASSTSGTSVSSMPLDLDKPLKNGRESIMSSVKQYSGYNKDLIQQFSRNDKTQPSLAQDLTESIKKSELATEQQPTKYSSTQGGRDSGLSNRYAPQLPLRSRQYGRTLDGPMHQTMQDFLSKDIQLGPSIKKNESKQRISALSGSPRDNIKASVRSPPMLPINVRAAMIKAKFSSGHQVEHNSIRNYVQHMQRRRSPDEARPILRHASILEVIKLTTRLSVPKARNNRARYIERRKRLQSLDTMPFSSTSHQKFPSLTVPTSTTKFQMHTQEQSRKMIVGEHRRNQQNKTQMTEVVKGLQSPFARSNRIDMMGKSFKSVSPTERGQKQLALDATIRSSQMQNGGLFNHQQQKQGFTQSQKSQTSIFSKEETRLSPFRHRQTAINELEKKSSKPNRFSIHSPNRSPSLKIENLTDTRPAKQRMFRDRSPKVESSSKRSPLGMAKEQLNKRSGSALDRHLYSNSKFQIPDSANKQKYALNITFQNVSRRQSVSPHYTISTRSPSPRQIKQSPNGAKSQRKSAFELNCGLLKQRSSFLKESKDRKIEEMLRKTKDGQALLHTVNQSSNDDGDPRASQMSNVERYEQKQIGKAIYENFSSQADDRVLNLGSSEFLKTQTGISLKSQQNDSDDEINKIPFQKKTVSAVTEPKRSKDQKINIEIIKKCMKYANAAKKNNTVRNHEIDMSIEDYLADQQKYFFRLLEEIESYPPVLQKQLLNYKWNYDDEQEMQSREIIHMYRTGETDPRHLLSTLMRKALENPSEGESDEEDSLLVKIKKPKLPNLSCFRKKSSQDYIRAAEN